MAAELSALRKYLQGACPAVFASSRLARGLLTSARQSMLHDVTDGRFGEAALQRDQPGECPERAGSDNRH